MILKQHCLEIYKKGISKFNLNNYVAKMLTNSNLINFNYYYAKTNLLHKLSLQVFTNLHLKISN